MMIKDNIVIVSGIDAIKKISMHPDFNGRPDGFFFRIRSFNKRLGIVFTDGKLWEDQRKFSFKTLKALGLGRLSMIEHIEREIKELVKSLQRSEKNVVEIQSENSNVFDVSVVNVMWTILRGERFDLNDKKLQRLMEMVHRSFKVIDMSGGVLGQMPWIRFIAPYRSGYQTLIDTMTPLWKFLEETIDGISSIYDLRDEPRNFIEFYCREMVQDSTFTREQLLALCIDFFQAGSETTSNTLAFGILYMLHYPRVMRKVQKELDNVVGERFPSLNDRKNLNFVQATLNEIQRIANVAPNGNH